MKNEVLYITRILKGISQEKFAKWLGIPYWTYVAYENCKRVPRNKHAEIILKKLELNDGLVFFPHLYQEKEDDVPEKIIHRIAKQMNSMSKRRYFNNYEISIIQKSVRAESLIRRFRKQNINAKTNEGQTYINRNTATIANCLLNATFKISANDVALYKRCKTFEYENRTGKSIWGIPEAREYYGFDPETGKEIKEV